MSKPSWRAVNNTRHSFCGSAKLSDLDFGNWWMDHLTDTYIHVYRASDETWHRVYARRSLSTRLAMKDGVLYWIIDRWMVADKDLPPVEKFKGILA